jgi:hypothetical protein
VADGIQIQSPAKKHYAVSLDTDAVLSPSPSAIYVGTGGNVVCSLIGDPTYFVTYKNVSSGQILDIRPHTIKSTANGTSAADIVAIGSE